jgi:outer membrane lipoprotein SlyB
MQYFSEEMIIKTVPTLMAGLVACAMTLGAGPSMAQTSRYAPTIQSFDVDEVRRLRPGNDLDFTLDGTPGGRATLRINGARKTVQLRETSPGRYVGTYTIGKKDRIVANSRVTATLKVGNRSTTGVLPESLTRDGPDRVIAVAAPRIERFQMDPVREIDAGSELNFFLTGTPGARVELDIAGARDNISLPEVAPGQYRGTYTVRRADRLRPDSVVTASIQNGTLVSKATLGQPLLAAVTPSDSPRVVRYCTNCGVIEAVNVINEQGQSTAVGSLGGAVIGGLLGNQVGSGSGRTAATAAGAIGGALAGREIEQRRNARQHFEVRVRYENGSVHTLNYPNDPGFRVGERVKVNDGVLSHDR